MIEWAPYQHPDAGFGVEVPSGWETAEDVLGCAAIFRAPASTPEAFQANFTVALPLFAEAPSLEDFTAGQLAQAGRLLTDIVLLDIDKAELVGFPAQRVLCTYRQGIYSLALEQWWAMAGEGAVVLSATSEALSYNDYAGLFSRMAASFTAVDDGS